MILSVWERKNIHIFLPCCFLALFSYCLEQHLPITLIMLHHLWPRSLVEPSQRMKALELHISCVENLRLNGLLVPSDLLELASSMDSSSMIEMVWIKHKLRDREKTLSHTHIHLATERQEHKKLRCSFFRSQNKIRHTPTLKCYISQYKKVQF